MCYIGSRGRQGGIPENISRMAEEYQKSIKPPYDKDDIISAFECGYMFTNIWRMELMWQG